MKRISIIRLLLSVAFVALISLSLPHDTEGRQSSNMNVLRITDTIPLSGKSERPMHSSITFPTVRGSNLEGKDFVLPGDFGGTLNLLFVAFQREQQAMVNTWLPFAKTLSERYLQVSYYELPTIERLNPLFQWFINRGMRSGIPDSTARATTITLYLDKPTFREALNIPHEDTIYVFLVNDTGQVVWRAAGVRTNEVSGELQDVIRLYRQSPNRPYNITVTP